MFYSTILWCSLHAENTGVGDDEHQEVEKGKKCLFDQLMWCIEWNLKEKKHSSQN